MQSGSIQNNWEGLAFNNLRVSTMKKIIFMVDEHKHEVGDEEDLGRPNHQP